MTDPEDAARIVLKALQGLAASERDVVLQHLVAGGLGGQQPARPTGPRINPRDLEAVELLGSGLGHAEVAERLGIPETNVRGCALRICLAVASAGGVAPWEPSILARFAEGRTRGEVAEQLALSEQTVQERVREIVERMRLARGGRQAVLTPMTVAGPHQMLPVRLPEEQHRRLKEWCEEHGFSMAVVIRGLVERFLEDQGRRAS